MHTTQIDGGVGVREIFSTNQFGCRSVTVQYVNLRIGVKQGQTGVPCYFKGRVEIDLVSVFRRLFSL